MPLSVQYQHTILREALGHAVKWQLLARNPAEAVESPRRQAGKERTTAPAKKEARALSPAEQRRLLEVAKDGPYYHLILVALNTGLRRGELLGLKWEDIDLAVRKLTVNRTVERVGGELVLQEPKTERSRRTIPFTATVGNAFYELKKRQAQDRLRLGERYRDQGLVFCWENGRMMDPANVTKQFAKLAKKAELEGITFHSLRHTFASTLIARGARLEEVQRLLGHGSLSTTMDIYHHLLPGALEATMALLED